MSRDPTMRVEVCGAFGLNAARENAVMGELSLG